MSAVCAVYGKTFSDTDPCPHCEWEREMAQADIGEFHWVTRDGSVIGICEFRGGWFWTDETENFGNYEPCATQAEAEAQQTEYARHL